MEEDLEERAVECPSCFINHQLWTSTANVKNGDDILDQVLCDFCEKLDGSFPYSKKLLMRRLEVLDEACAFRFPAVIRHLVEHLELKEF